jgi:hypothetical protein
MTALLHEQPSPVDGAWTVGTQKKESSFAKTRPDLSPLDSCARLRQQGHGRRFGKPEGQTRVDDDRGTLQAGGLRADTGRHLRD